MADTTRVELQDGNWADVRTKRTLGDLRAIERARIERGGVESPTLDMLVMFERIITAWSYPVPVTPEAIEEHILLDDLTALTAAMADTSTDAA